MDFIFAACELMFPVQKLMFPVQKHMFPVQKHKNYAMRKTFSACARNLNIIIRWKC